MEDFDFPIASEQVCAPLDSELDTLLQFFFATSRPKWQRQQLALFLLSIT